MKPNITIIVTCFNAERYLADCLDSILNQNYEAWEVFFVDDASNDQSLGIARKYATQDQRFKIIENQTNIGHYASINKALGMTQTEFFSRVDADDTIHPDYLVKCIEVIASTSKIGAIFVNFRYFNEKGESSDDYPKLVSNKAFGIDQLLPEGKLKRSRYYFDSSLSDYFRGIGIIRTDLVNKLGGFEEWISESDILLYLKIACKANVFCLNDRLYSYRKHSTSATSKISENGQDLNWKKKFLIEANEVLLENKILSAREHKKQKQSIVNEYHRHKINRARKKLNLPSALIHSIKLMINLFR
ncbi:glycosyltransferase family 2 protein [Reichenbachiella sp.]|uniref:glycosyltransferase family 2 protein n=1 Tax=Reichenbachiella sp. TaxID=2184521 RepID=UPI0032979ABD